MELIPAIRGNIQILIYIYLYLFLFVIKRWDPSPSGALHRLYPTPRKIYFPYTDSTCAIVLLVKPNLLFEGGMLKISMSCLILVIDRAIASEKRVETLKPDS